VEKAINLRTLKMSLCFALITQHAMRLRHIVIYGCTEIFHISHKRRDFRKEKEKLFNINLCFDFLYSFRLKNFSFLEELSEM